MKIKNIYTKIKDMLAKAYHAFRPIKQAGPAEEKPATFELTAYFKRLEIKNKKILLGGATAIGVIVIGIILIIANNQSRNKPQDNQNQQTAQPTNPFDNKYIVELQIVELKNGVEEKEIAPGVKQITKIQGSPVTGDLTGDNQIDYAMVITQEIAGQPGVYYYVAAALSDTAGKIALGVNAVPIDEGIKIEKILIESGMIEVDYLARKINGDAVEPEATVPALKKFAIEGVMLKELTDALQKRVNARFEAVCTDNGGIWVKTTNECEGTTKDWCDRNHGEYDQCASACRNDPKIPATCAKQCVPVCKF